MCSVTGTAAVFFFFVPQEFKDWADTTKNPPQRQLLKLSLSQSILLLRKLYYFNIQYT